MVQNFPFMFGRLIEVGNRTGGQNTNE